jgi:hypothetical protein
VNKPTKAPPPSTRHTRRWPASLAVLAVLVLQLLVPAQINALPRWLMPALGFLLLLPLVWTNPFHLRRDEPWLRSVEMALVGVPGSYIPLVTNAMPPGRRAIRMTMTRAGFMMADPAQ